VIALVLGLGLVCWIVTTIICESQLTKPLRDLVKRKRTFFVWLDYLLSCPLCVGVWVGIAETLYVQVRPGFAGFVFSALLYKAVGHLVLELRPQAWTRQR
jgi:Protein of unknown function (DUF1360)